MSRGAVCKQFPEAERAPASGPSRAALLPAPQQVAGAWGPQPRLTPLRTLPSPPELQLCSGFVGETVLVFRHRRKFTLV